jgi:hypothetical protein
MGELPSVIFVPSGRRLIPNLMPRVSECGLVVFCRAGRPPAKTSLYSRRFLIPNGIPFEPIVMKPLRGKTAFQGLYLLDAGPS